MVNIKNKGYTSPIAIHPGKTIKETLELANISQVDLSKHMDLSERMISQILNGSQPVTPETALKFERVLGLSQQMLVQMQAFYDADKARIEEAERLRDETKLLARYTCYPELVKLEYVTQSFSDLKKVEELLRFFRVNSLNAVKTVFPVAFRRFDSEKIIHESIAAWLRMGMIQAEGREVSEFNRELLVKNIAKMRDLTREEPGVYSKNLIELCAQAGVVLVYTPHLKNTRVNGATRWISPQRALVQLSLYNRYADIFWFTLFHELGHLLKHSKKEMYVDLEVANNTENEKEADVFSQSISV